MSDKFVEDGEDLVIENPAVEIVRPGDEGHIDDSDGTFGKAAEAGEPDDEHQELTEEQLDAFRVLSPERPQAEEARVGLQATLERALARQGRRVVGAVRGRLERLEKAVEPEVTAAEAAAAAAALAAMEREVVRIAIESLGSWDFVIDGVSSALEEVAEDAVQQAVAVIGVDNADDLFEQVSERSVRMAQERAAELVGRRVLADGSIIDNPNAQWAISQSTREQIKATIERVIRNNEGSDALIQALEEDHAFSPARAEMVSRTEIADINSRAQMETYHTAAETGVGVKKRWVLGPRPCVTCRENAAQGAIPLEESFQSGDDTAPAHPNCVCAVVPEVD